MLNKTKKCFFVCFSSQHEKISQSINAKIPKIPQSPNPPIPQSHVNICLSQVVVLVLLYHRTVSAVQIISEFGNIFNNN